MKKQPSLKVYISVLLAMVFFSLSFVWFKVANIHYGPMTIVLFRLVISSVILFTFVKLTKKLVLPNKQELKYLLLLAFFEPFLYFMGESYGLQHISSTVGAVIISTIPLVTPFAAYFFLKEKVTLKNLIGIVVSFIGVILVIFEYGNGLTASPLGVLLQFAAVFAAVGYSIILNKIPNRMNNISILLFQNMFGSIYFLPFWSAFEFKRVVNMPFDYEGFMAIIKLAIFASTLAYIFFTYSIRNLGVTKSNMFTNSIPVFTAIFAWIILGDTLNVQKILGIVIVISGLFIAQFKRRSFKNGPNPIPRT